MSWGSWQGWHGQGGRDERLARWKSEGYEHGWSRGEGAWRREPLIGDSFLQVAFPVLSKSLEGFKQVQQEHALGTHVVLRGRRGVNELTIYGGDVASAFDDVLELLLKLDAQLVLKIKFKPAVTIGLDINNTEETSSRSIAGAAASSSSLRSIAVAAACSSETHHGGDGGLTPGGDGGLALGGVGGLTPLVASSTPPASVHVAPTRLCPAPLGSFPKHIVRLVRGAH